MSKPKPKQVSKPITPEQFAERYKALCQETGYQVIFEPVWVRSADAGDFRLSIRIGVGRMPK